MKRSEAIKLIENLWIETTDGDLILGPTNAEDILERLLEAGFPIPCNKKGKFDWDAETQTDGLKQD